MFTLSRNMEQINDNNKYKYIYTGNIDAKIDKTFLMSLLLPLAPQHLEPIQKDLQVFDNWKRNERWLICGPLWNCDASTNKRSPISEIKQTDLNVVAMMMMSQYYQNQFWVEIYDTLLFVHLFCCNVWIVRNLQLIEVSSKRH